ncbi:hypothetical protein AAGG74_16405 [Bacillus mexicanus]|uniref:hypothetical protein n=1 Tax=Bacillus mexicanus TaxID=2834415 RepID=UPI003D19F91D
MCIEYNNQSDEEYENLRPPARGIMPRDIWESKRIKEIKTAMDRKLSAKEKIPQEWIEEYNDLINRVNTKEKEMNNRFEKTVEVLEGDNVSKEMKLYFLLDLLYNDEISLNKAREYCTKIGLFSDHWVSLELKTGDLLNGCISTENQQNVKYECSVCNSMYTELEKANECCWDYLHTNGEKIKELLNRNAKSWGNVSIKTFEQDIKTLTDYVRVQQELIKRIVG